MTYYQIEISKIYESKAKNILKRYSNFEALNYELLQMGIPDLPVLPSSFMPLQF